MAALGAEHLFWLATAAFAIVLRSLILAGEAGLSAVGRERASELADQNRAGRALAQLKADTERTAGGLRAALALCFAGAVTVAGREAVMLDQSVSIHVPGVLAVAVALVVVWSVTILLDVLPRSLAAAHPEEWALRTAPLLLFLRELLYPPIRVIGGLVDVLVRPVGARLRFSLPPPPLDEIERILTHNQDEGAPAPELVRSLFEFGDLTAKEIMIPRTDIVAIPEEMDPTDIMNVLVDQGHTRLPVYRGTLDTIIGIIHIKDLLPLLANPELIILHDLLRPPLFVPWNRPVDKVMRELQRKRQHFAVVVDEYGGVSGIVTLEDIVEQIVGDIRDEFDEEEAEVTASNDGTLLVKADMRVTQFNEQFNADVPEDDGYETMSGFVSSLAGAIPSEGDRFYHRGWEFLVTRRDPRRVTELRVTRPRADGTQPRTLPREPAA
jgi:CBS domain containing-hemolysin-like protein